jgi:hypothetical protein
MVVGTDVGSLTNTHSVRSQGANASQLQSGISLKSRGDPGSGEVSIIGDSLCISRNVIIYIDTSIRHYGKIFDMVAYRCLIFLVCYSDPAEYFSELCRLNSCRKTHIQR